MIVFDNYAVCEEQLTCYWMHVATSFRSFDIAGSRPAIGRARRFSSTLRAILGPKEEASQRYREHDRKPCCLHITWQRIHVHKK